MTTAFSQRFGGTPKVFRAPGRVNLIGEHTDYNEGFVMPAAIGFYTYTAVGARHDRKLSVYSLNFAEQVDLELDSLPDAATGHWSDYVIGVAQELQSFGLDLSGAELLIDGNVPLGAGLSSSASLEVAVALALLGVSGATVERIALAQICQKAENNFVGARCGIMDQFISCHGRVNHALKLDCRSLDYKLLPLDPGIALLICNTMVRHSIASGEYNRRREECESGVKSLSAHLPNIKALRDVTMTELASHDGSLSDVVYRRCRHIVSENARVGRAAVALEQADLSTFGRLMAESHMSLRNDFEVSCAELDQMVEIADGCAGVYGTRMTGGGFGGCTISLVDANAAEAAKLTILDLFEQATGICPEIYICTAAEGAGLAG